jgi:hypothetical protein
MRFRERVRYVASRRLFRFCRLQDRIARIIAVDVVAIHMISPMFDADAQRNPD